MIREKAPREGKIGTTATKVAGGLESASDYLQEKKFDHLGEDFTGLGSSLPSAVSIGRSWFRLFARRT